jgi:hypothetical protein
MSRLEQIGIALDQLVNALLGGYADETLSARIWRHRATWKRRLLIVNTLFFWQINHCKEAYESELYRKQLPKEYQQGGE